MPRNITFSGDTPKKILNLNGEYKVPKTMTARFWKQKPPAIGDIVTASKNRHASSRFAKLKILNVFSWIPGTDTSLVLWKKSGYTPQQIAEKEGFSDFDEFFDAYATLNNHLDPHDPERTHYFIEFEVVEIL